MTIPVLERLKSEEFLVAVGFASTAGALRRILRRLGEVPAISKALRQGEITEESIRIFVSSIMRDFRSGEQFVHEVALAALAVVMETRPTPFAEEFLRDLSRLELGEMGLCIRLARECLKRQASFADDASRVFTLGQTSNGTSFSAKSDERAQEMVPRISNEFVTCKVA